MKTLRFLAVVPLEIGLDSNNIGTQPEPRVPTQVKSWYGQWQKRRTGRSGIKVLETDWSDVCGVLVIRGYQAQRSETETFLEAKSEG